MPSLLPAHVRWPGAPQPAQEITGAPRGRPGRPRSEAAKGGREAIVGLCSSFPSIAGLPEAPGSSRRLPRPQLSGLPQPDTRDRPTRPRLLKGQVQSGDAVLSVLGVGHPGPALAGQGTDRWALGPRLTLPVSLARGPAAGARMFGRKTRLGP